MAQIVLQSAAANTHTEAPGSVQRINLLIINKGDARNVALQLQGSNIQLLGAPNTPLSLPARDTLLYPVVYLLAKQTAYTQQPVIQAKLYNKKRDSILSTTAIKVQVAAVQKIAVNLERTDIYLQSATEVPQIQLNCSNRGNTTEVLYIRALAAGEQSNNTQSRQLKLSPGAEQSVKLLPPYRPNGTQPSTAYIIQVSRPDGEVLFSSICRVHQVYGKQAYTGAVERVEPWGSDQVALLANYSKQYQFYELIASKSFQGKDLHGRIDLDALYFTPYKTANFRSSFFNIDYKGWRLDAGALNRNYDMWLAGRGLIARMPTGTHSRLEAGYVNGSFDITAPLLARNNMATNSVYTLYSRTKEQHESFSAGAFYQYDPLLLERKYLGSLHWTPLYNARRTLTIMTDGSAAADIHNARSYKAGGLLGVYYNERHTRWSLASGNVYSTPYFTGLQRGVLYLDERFNYQLSSPATWWARFFTSDNKPQYLHPGFDASAYRSTQRTLETGFTFQSKHFWQLATGYSYNTEESSTLFQLQPGTLSSHQASLTMRYTRPNSVFLNMETIGGYFTTGPANPDHYMGVKNTVSVSYKNYSLYSIVQSGAFYVNETLQQAISGSRFRFYAIAAQCNGSILRQRLQYRISEQVATGSYYTGWYNTLNAQLDYQLFSKLFLHGGVLYNSSYQFAPSFTQWQGGIIRRFNTRDAADLSATVFFFRDNDNNGRFGPGDAVATGLLLQLDDMPLRTDPKGRLICRHLRPGRHTMTLLDATDWHLFTDTVWITRKRSNLAIALNRLGTIRGRLQVMDDSTGAKRTDLTGILFTARDSSGKAYSTVCDGNGLFAFYLPAGSYEVGVNAATLPPQLVCYEAALLANATMDPSGGIVFKARTKEKRVRIKRFSQDDKAAIR